MAVRQRYKGTAGRGVKTKIYVKGSGQKRVSVKTRGRTRVKTA